MISPISGYQLTKLWFCFGQFDFYWKAKLHIKGQMSGFSSIPGIFWPEFDMGRWKFSVFDFFLDSDVDMNQFFFSLKKMSNSATRKRIPEFVKRRNYKKKNSIMPLDLVENIIFMFCHQKKIYKIRILAYFFFSRWTPESQRLIYFFKKLS